MTWGPFLVHFVAGQAIVWILGLIPLLRQDIVQAQQQPLAKVPLCAVCNNSNSRFGMAKRVPRHSAEIHLSLKKATLSQSTNPPANPYVLFRRLH
jgi:hypothetical protein